MYPDYIDATVYGFWLFMDDLGNFMQAPTIISKKKLPRLDSDGNLKYYKSLASYVRAVSVSVVLISSAICRYSLSPLKYILDQIK